MEIDKLYVKIKEAYSDKNLNRITARVIDLYKSKEYDAIKDLTNIVSEYVEIKEEKISRCFSKLIMIYHPDRANQYRSQIEAYYNAGDQENLLTFSHILAMENIETSDPGNDGFVDEDYQPEYAWDPNFAEYGFYSYTEDDLTSDYNTDDIPKSSSFQDNSFFGAVKRKVYGNINAEFHAFYLEDLEDIDMPDYEIDNLEGIKNCVQANYIDLSRNNISDITDLNPLTKVEELYLADNQINFIDALVSMKNLRMLDLSNNFIDDISVLSHLDSLEYLNIIGNNVPLSQIRALESNDVIVIY